MEIEILLGSSQLKIWMKYRFVLNWNWKFGSFALYLSHSSFSIRKEWVEEEKELLMLQHLGLIKVTIGNWNHVRSVTSFRSRSPACFTHRVCSHTNQFLSSPGKNFILFWHYQSPPHDLEIIDYSSTCRQSTSDKYNLINLIQLCCIHTFWTQLISYLFWFSWCWVKNKLLKWSNWTYLRFTWS